jgi:digeranylgeranylglycerophospholipid reductase
MCNTPAMLDVAVVGGGPAGLFAAQRCAEAGLDVHLFEEHETPGEPVHCTGIISRETTKFAKIEDELILARLHRARLGVGDDAAHEVSWEPATGEEILVIDRAAFDRSLARQAIEAGARLETGARVTQVIARSDGIDIEVGRRLVRARACVLACGVSYRFHHGLGFARPALVTRTAQIEGDAPPSDTVELRFGRHVAPGGFLWMVPVTRAGEPRAKVGVMTQGNARACLDNFLAAPEGRRRITRLLGPPRHRLLPLEAISPTFADRVLVVGDAGGFTKPTTGGGIFYSLLTASLAAETLVEAFQAGRFEAAFLARYERRWRDVLASELRIARWVRHVLARCNDAEIGRLLAVFGSLDCQHAVRQAARFNWHRSLILTLARQHSVALLLVRLLAR